MIAERLKRYLDEKHVPYEHHIHRTAYTAQQVAAEEHVPGRMVAKTVILANKDGYLMAVLPAPLHVDLGAMRALLGQPDARLATESEFGSLFPDSETGAMPPFGHLYGLPVYVDRSLARDDEIVFNAGTHRDTIRMRFEDFARLARPELADFALQRTAA
jgi:Ala-tRNA(Pro) deacylase